MPRIDPRALRPTQLVRLLNSTPLGQVVGAYDIYRQRNAAGYRIGDGKTINLVRYAAWLMEERRRMTKATKRRGRRRTKDAARNLTKEEVASVLSIHARTVTRYAGEGMPHEQGGHGQPHLYNLTECVEWLTDQGRNPFPDEPSGAPEDGTKAGVELKLKREKARLAELERLEREEALHDVAECRAHRIQQLWALKRRLLAIPRSVAPRLEGRDRTEIETALTEAMTEILARFAEGYVDGQA